MAADMTDAEVERVARALCLAAIVARWSATVFYISCRCSPQKFIRMEGAP